MILSTSNKTITIGFYTNTPASTRNNNHNTNVMNTEDAF
jgi:hypothetical protein